MSESVNDECVAREEGSYRCHHWDKRTKSPTWS
jgi:hypothetical protein